MGKLNKGNLVPNVRFDGFDDEWVESKLGDVGEILMCRRIYKDETSDCGDIPFFKIGTFGSTPDTFIDRAVFVDYREQYPYPNKGDILISAAGTLGRTVVYGGDDEYFQDSNIVWLSGYYDKLDNIFLKQFYDTVDWNISEGSTIKRLYNGIILSICIAYPTLPEQSLIGNFFKTVDDLISAEKDQLANIEAYKEAMLQKMFPKKGVVVPDIRFKGFDDQWTDGHIYDALTHIKRGNLVKVDVQSKDELMTLSLNLNGLSVGSNRVLSLGSTAYYRRFEGQFIYGKQNIFKGSMAIVGDIYDGLATSGDVPALDIKVEINTDYFYSYVSRQTWYEGLERYASGTGSKRLHESDFLKVVFNYPTLLEQESIGNFFKNLDDTIESHKQKLETYATMKEAFLQKMFV